MRRTALFIVLVLALSLQASGSLRFGIGLVSSEPEKILEVLWRDGYDADLLTEEDLRAGRGAYFQLILDDNSGLGDLMTGNPVVVVSDPAELVSVIESMGIRQLPHVIISMADWLPMIENSLTGYNQGIREFRTVERMAEPISAEVREVYELITQAKEALDWAVQRDLPHRVGHYLRLITDRSNEIIAPIQPVRQAEARAIWIDYQTLVASRNEEGLREMVRMLAKANINMIFPETVYNGSTLYPSKIGTQNPDYVNRPEDPLQVIIEEASLYGIEVHPWVWVFCSGYWHEYGPILVQNPHWAEQDSRGRTFSDWEYGTAWLNPTMPEVTDYLLSLYAEILTNYDVQGLHIDYIRYNEEPVGSFGYSPYSLQTFQAQTGFTEEALRRGDRQAREAFDDWRRGNVTSFVIQVRELLDSYEKDLALSAAVVPDPHRSYHEVMQEWQNWIKDGYLDFLMTMAYTDSIGDFANLARQGLALAEDRIPLYPGLGLYVNDRWSNLGQIRATRELGATGVALFSVASLRGPKLADVTQGLFRDPAIIPMRQPLDSIEILVQEGMEKLAHLPHVDLGDLPGQVLAMFEGLAPGEEAYLALAEGIGEVLRALETLWRARGLNRNEFTTLSSPWQAAYRICRIELTQMGVEIPAAL